MLEDMRVRPEKCISEPSSDVSLNWKDMRSEFRYTMLYKIATLKSFNFSKW